MPKEFYAHADANRRQLVYEHLESTAFLCSSFAEKIHCGSMGSMLGWLHDIGKYSDLFAARLANPKETAKCDHSTYGAVLLHGCVEASPFSLLMEQILQICILGHHGGLKDIITVDGTDLFRQRLQKELGEQENVSLRGANVLKNVRELLMSAQKEIEQAYFFIQGHEQDGENRLFFEALTIKYLYSCLIDADRLDTAFWSSELPCADFVPWQTITAAIDTFSGNFSTDGINAFRSLVYQDCAGAAQHPKGFFNLATPTGGGKTIASFRFAAGHAAAHQMDRIIYVLPFLSIIEQNAAAISDLLKKEGVAQKIVWESHSNAAVQENAQQQVKYQMTDNWNGQIIFTTLVQFLENIFGGGTRGVRRFHHMTNAVIIFDEVQSMPLKTVYLANLLMRFLVEICGSTVVLCSATQPALDHLLDHTKSLPKPHALSNRSALFPQRTHIANRCTSTGYTDDQIAEMAIVEANRQGSVLIITNTKATARGICAALLARQESPFYLSTDLCAQHRGDVLDTINKNLERHARTFCVSTAVIEAGVDISFGSVIRCLCGLDSIVQAAGRCNRHAEQEDTAGNKLQGRVLVVNPAHENLASLPEIMRGAEITRRIFNELREGQSILDEDVICQYFRYLYYDQENRSQNALAYPIPKEKAGVSSTALELLTINRSGRAEFERKRHEKPKMRYCAAFATVGEHYHLIEQNTVGLIVPYQDGQDLIARLGTMPPHVLQKKAQRYLVNIFQNELSRDGVCCSSEGIYYLDPLYYDPVYGRTKAPTRTQDFEGGFYG